MDEIFLLMQHFVDHHLVSSALICSYVYIWP